MEKYRVTIINKMFDVCEVEAEDESKAHEIVKQALYTGEFWDKNLGEGVTNGEYWEVDILGTELITESDK